MKRSNLFRGLSILFYLSIMLNGRHIGVPMFLYMLFALTPASWQQVYALLGWVGICLILFRLPKVSTRNKKTITVFAFCLLLVPLSVWLAEDAFRGVLEANCLVPMLAFAVLYGLGFYVMEQS